MPIYGSNEFDPSVTNIHTHSYYCGHGVGKLRDYVDVAKREGLKVLGFSEHCPTPTNRWSGSRMSFNKLEQYLNQCRDLQATNSDIIILTGLECDYEPKEHNWYKEYLIDSGRVDYLIAGVHYLTTDSYTDRYIQLFPNDKKALHLYTDNYIKILESGLFKIGVHPDIFGRFYDDWDDEAKACSISILECATSLQIPLEINGDGLNKRTITTKNGKRLMYPLIDFWELSREYPIKVVTNSDAHRPENVKSQLLNGISYAQNLGIGLSPIHIETSIEGKLNINFR